MKHYHNAIWKGRTLKRTSSAAALAAGLIMLTLLVTGGAASGQPSEAATSTPLVIGSMIWNTSVPFYANMIRGERVAAKQLHATLKLVSGNGDISTEVSEVEQFVTEKVSAILVTPSSPTGIVPAVRLANAAHIPVFAINNLVGSAAQVVTYVGVSDYTYGQQQAHLLVRAIGTHGTVAYVLGEIGTSAELNRKAGFFSVLKSYPKIRVVAMQTADWDNSKALSVVQDWLSKYPKGTLNAIVDQGPEGATAARYVATTGRSEIKFIVGDYPSSVRSEILKHQIYGTCDQNPYPQGYLGIKYATEWVRGDKGSVPRPDAWQPLPLVTAANAANTPPAWVG